MRLYVKKQTRTSVKHDVMATLLEARSVPKRLPFLSHSSYPSHLHLGISTSPAGLEPPDHKDGKVDSLQASQANTGPKGESLPQLSARDSTVFDLLTISVQVSPKLTSLYP